MLTAKSPRSIVEELAGGKGLGLFDLTNWGMPVPTWTILGVDVLRRFLAATGIDSLIENELNGLAETPGDEALEAAAHRIGSAIIEAELPAETAAALSAAYVQIGEGPTAVRSSAVGEDSALSFAEHYATRLNVVGPDAVTEAVQACWASAWSVSALKYRVMNDLPLRGVEIAVIMQALVPAEKSGVLFTVNPATGCSDEFVVNAAYGLGEAVAPDIVEPDTVVLARGDGMVQEETIGAKEWRIDALPEGGCRTRAPSWFERLSLVLSEAELGELHEQGKRLEQLNGAPQDVEWAIARGKLWILQSRPVTGHSQSGRHAKSIEKPRPPARRVAPELVDDPAGGGAQLGSKGLAGVLRAVRTYRSERFPLSQAGTVLSGYVCSYLFFGQAYGHQTFAWATIAGAISTVLLALVRRIIDDFEDLRIDVLSGRFPADGAARRRRGLVCGALAVTAVLGALNATCSVSLLVISVAVAAWFPVATALKHTRAAQTHRSVFYLINETMPVAGLVYPYAVWHAVSGTSLSAIAVVAITGLLWTIWEFWMYTRKVGVEGWPPWGLTMVETRRALMIFLVLSAAFSVLVDHYGHLAVGYLVYSVSVSVAFAAIILRWWSRLPAHRSHRVRAWWAWGGLSFPVAVEAGVLVAMLISQL